MRVQVCALVVVSALLASGCDQPPESPGRDVSTDMAVPYSSPPDAGDICPKERRTRV